MRNLKRALSLALAAVMVIGMMVIGAGAVSVNDFTDNDEIKNKEAVTTMVALGVINGKDDGSYFDPTGIVTRAEMAKMITVALNGGTDPVLATKSTPSYTDIDGHWAENYIEYCTSRSIISGRGNGKFDPDATVTAAEAAKMILTALGYDATVFGLTGTSWQIKTDVLANDSKANLYEGLSSLSSSNDLSRDNAAQMIYNALDAYVMERSYDQVLANGQVTYSYKLSETTTFIMDAFGAVKVEGVVVGNEQAVLTSSTAGSHLDANRTRIQVTNHGTGDGEQNVFSGNLTLQAATGLDELGRSVSVYVKSSSSSTRATVLGSVIVSGDNVVVTDYSGDSIATVASDNHLNLNGTQTALNYASVANYAASVTGNSTRGVEKILIDNDDDGDLDYVLLNTYRFGKVTSYVTSGDGSITVNCGSNNTFSKSDKDDVLGFEDVAKDNYVLAAEIGGRLHVEKAESVTGELGGYRQSDSTVAPDISANAAVYTNRLSVGGTNYNVGWLTGYTGGTDDIQAGYNYGATSLDTEATFYLGKGDYVLAVGNVAENAYNYALVLAADQSGVSDQVRVALSDGTKGTYTVNTNGDTYSNANTNTNTSDKHFGIGSLCSYTLSGSTIRLTEVNFASGFSGQAGTAFTKNRTGITANSKTVYTNSSTAFFYVNGATLTPAGNISSGDVNVYTGYASAPSLKNTGATSYVHTNSAGRAVAVVFVGDGITTANVDDNLYIYSKGNTGNDYTNVSAFMAGSSDPVADVKATGDVAAEGIRLFSIDSDGYYDLKAPDTYNSVAGTGNLIGGTFTNGVSDWKVTSSNANTFVITKGSTSYELEIKSDTLLVNDSGYLDDPTAELGAGPDEDDNIAYILFSLDNGKPDEAKLVVFKNSNSNSTTPTPPTTTFNGINTVSVDMNSGTAVVNYHGALNAAALRNLIRTTYPSMTTVTVSGSDTTDFDITMNDGTGAFTIANGDITFNEYFEVKYNGTSHGYYKTTDTDFDITATAATVSVIDGVNSKASADATASNGKIPVDVSTLTDDVDYWDAYAVTINGTSKSQTANGDAFASTNLVKVGVTVVVTATEASSTVFNDTISVNTTPVQTVTAGAAGDFSLTFTMGSAAATVTIIANADA